MNNYRLALSLFAFMALLISCQNSAPTVFNKNGVSFSYPSDWAISDEEAFDAGYYVSIDRDGFSSSGLVTLTWVDQILDLNDHLEFYKNEFRENAIYKNSDLTFNEKKETEFNGIPALAVSYTVTILTVKHEGKMYAFNDDNRTYLVVKQGATDDRAQNESGFKSIEETFSLATDDNAITE